MRSAKVIGRVLYDHWNREPMSSAPAMDLLALPDTAFELVCQYLGPYLYFLARTSAGLALRIRTWRLEKMFPDPNMFIHNLGGVYYQTNEGCERLVPCIENYHITEPAVDFLYLTPKPLLFISNQMMFWALSQGIDLWNTNLVALIIMHNFQPCIFVNAVQNGFQVERLHWVFMVRAKRTELVRSALFTLNLNPPAGQFLHINAVEAGSVVILSMLFQKSQPSLHEQIGMWNTAARDGSIEMLECLLEHLKLPFHTAVDAVEWAIIHNSRPVINWFEAKAPDVVLSVRGYIQLIPAEPIFFPDMDVSSDSEEDEGVLPIENANTILF